VLRTSRKLIVASHRSEGGFHHVMLIVAIVVIGAIGFVGWKVASHKQKEPATNNSALTATSDNKAEIKSGKSSDKPIKHIGVSLDYYDPATNKAGDFVFTKANFSSGIQLLFADYGYVIAGNISSTGQAKSNPQPTFILPLGTKVHSLVDGEVFNVPKLYSDDYSVMVQPDGSNLVFETEHVKNVLVKKGDKVKAGDVIAEVSDYSAHGYNGLGLVEIGVLKGGNPPQHLCPFTYLDDSVKDDIQKKIKALYKSWEEYRGDDSLYDESKHVVPGCYSLTPIDG